jgi:branched-chain amino acid transport system permease protein
MNYLEHIVILIGIYVILGQSLNLPLGFTGLLSLCQAAFYGIGAYTTALLMIHYEMSFFIALPISMMLVVIVSIVIAHISIHLKKEYFVLATIGFQSVIFAILYNWISLTNGPYGVSRIPSIVIFNMKFDQTASFMLLIIIFVFAIVWFLHLLTKSQFGRIIKALREDELMTQALGQNTRNIKTIVFALGSGLAAIAGALYATYVGYIDPTSFTITESLFLVIILSIGGSGNIKGPIVGSMIVMVVPELLRFLQLPEVIAPNIRMILYALTLILFLIFKPKGIAGDYKFQ